MDAWDHIINSFAGLKQEDKITKPKVTNVYAAGGRWQSFGYLNGKAISLYSGKSYELAVEARRKFETENPSVSKRTRADNSKTNISEEL